MRTQPRWRSAYLCSGTVVSIAVLVWLTVICFERGIVSPVPYLYYLPIIGLTYYYQRLAGVYVAIVSAAYVYLTTLFGYVTTLTYMQVVLFVTVWVAVLGIVRMIAERDRDLQVLGTNYLMLANSVSDMIWVLIDPDTIGAMNASAASFFGVSELTRQHRVRDLSLREPSMSKVIADNIRVFDTKTVVDTERWVTTVAGTRRLLHIRKTPYFDGYGNVAAVVCAASDITDREWVRNESQNYIKSVIDANINYTLRSVGSSLDLDRIAVYRVDADVFTVDYAWASDRISPAYDMIGLYDRFDASWRTQLQQGQPVHGQIGDASVIVVPIVHSTQFCGFVVAIDRFDHRIDASTITTMRVVAASVTAMLEIADLFVPGAVRCRAGGVA